MATKSYNSDFFKIKKGLKMHHLDLFNLFL